MGVAILALHAKHAEKFHSYTTYIWVCKGFMLFIAFQSLIDALHNEVGDGNVKLGTEVLSLACCCDGVSSSGGWSISVDSKDAKGKDLRKNQSFDAVIMTVRKKLSVFISLEAWSFDSHKLKYFTVFFFLPL